MQASKGYDVERAVLDGVGPRRLNQDQIQKEIFRHEKVFEHLSPLMTFMIHPFQGFQSLVNE